MKDIYIINTHSHANMLKETNIDEAMANASSNNIVTMVPSSTGEDIFEVDKFISKYPDTYGYLGVFPEEVKTFTDKTLSDMELIIKKNKKIVGIGEKCFCCGLSFIQISAAHEYLLHVFIPSLTD